MPFPTVDIMPVIDFVTMYGQFVDAESFNTPICEDPDDDKFLECAIVGRCKIIISGDKHLLKLTGYKGITILSPRSVVDQYL